MALFPRHRILRIAAIAWLLVSTVLITVTLLRPEMQANDRAALSTLVPLYFLSLPLGHLGVMAVGKLKVALYVDSQAVLGIFAEGLILWACLAVLGYVQWFMILPWIARKTRQVTDFLFKRGPAR